MWCENNFQSLISTFTVWSIRHIKHTLSPQIVGIVMAEPYCISINENDIVTYQFSTWFYNMVER